MNMSSEFAGLAISAVVGAVLFVIAVLIRVRGPIGLVKNVDWSRVSDPHALGHYVSLMMSVLSTLIVAHGVVLYELRFNPGLRNAFSTVFVTCVCVLTLALALGQLRYQDKPKRDERR